MGQRGPAPVGKKDLERRGSRRAKDRPDDLEFEPKAPKRPASLKGEAKAEWNRIIPLLVDKGVVSEVDRAALIALCQAWADYQDFREAASRLVKGSMDWRRMVSAKHEAFAEWQSLAQRFGLTPADRPRVKINSPKAKDAEGKSRFFEPRIAKVS